MITADLSKVVRLPHKLEWAKSARKQFICEGCVCIADVHDSHGSKKRLIFEVHSFTSDTVKAVPGTIMELRERLPDFIATKRFSKDNYPFSVREGLFNTHDCYRMFRSSDTDLEHIELLPEILPSEHLYISAYDEGNGI